MRELYAFANGTKLSDDSDFTLGMIGLIPIHIFLNLNDVVDYYHAYTNKHDESLHDFFFNSDKDFKSSKKLFPFLEDCAGNCYWVDLNEDSENYQKIFWTNTFGEEPDYAFDSPTSMFQTIAECYEKNAITVDDEKCLDCDYFAFYRIAKQNNLSVNLWDSYLKDDD